MQRSFGQRWLAQRCRKFTVHGAFIPKKSVRSGNFPDMPAIVNMLAPEFTVLSRYERSFHAVGGPFHADSRAQNLCTEIGALQYVEQMKHLFCCLKVATNQIWIG